LRHRVERDLHDVTRLLLEGGRRPFQPQLDGARAQNGDLSRCHRSPEQDARDETKDCQALLHAIFLRP